MPVYTSDIDLQRRDIDVAKDIPRLIPDATPFAVILMRARKVPTKTAVFHWFDEEPYAWWAQINNAAGYAAADTNLVVTDASVFQPKDVIKVPRTGEAMFVTASNTTTNTVTVVRGYAGTTASPLYHLDWLLNLGNAMEEYSSAPAEKVKQPTRNYNYVQTFRTPFSESGRSAAEQKKTAEKERTRLRRSKAIEHRMAIERAMLFGNRYEDAANKRTTTGGLLQFITSNVINVNGVLTESQWEEINEAAFAYGSPTKLAVLAPRLVTAVNRFAAGKLVTQSGDETYGIRMRRYESGHGTLFIVTSRALEKEYAGYGFILDMENIAYRPLEGRDTTLRANIQANDADGWMDEYITDAGLMVRLEKTHAVIKGVTG